MAVLAAVASVVGTVVIDVAREQLRSPGAFLGRTALAPARTDGDATASAASGRGLGPTRTSDRDVAGGTNPSAAAHARAAPAPTPHMGATSPQPAGHDTQTPAVQEPPADAVPLPKVALPVPAPLPVNPYADTPHELVGHLTIPALDLDEEVQSGMTLTAINRGPSHWPGTALPGQLGNVVLAGHRTTFTHPFAGLDRLAPGDRATFTTSAGTFSYAVVGTEIVEPEALDIADQTAAYTATLFACHPPGSARFRIVAKLVLVDDAGSPVPPPRVTVTNKAAVTAFRT